MDIEEFEDCLDRFGEDLSRWPIEKRRLASELLAQSDEAHSLLREAAVLRGHLPKSSIQAPAGLADRIVVEAVKRSDLAAGVARQPAPRRSWALPILRDGRSLFLSVCFLAGLLAGILNSRPLNDPPEVNSHDYVAYLMEMVYPAD